MLKIEANDGANIGLMMLSLALAVFLPFELFIFSYAFFGPLHYLTEIFWLRKNHYYTNNSADSWVFLFFTTAASLLIFLLALAQNFEIPISPNLVSHHFAALVFLSFAAAGIFFITQDWWKRANLLVLAIFLMLVLRSIPAYVIIFGVLLTTIIHVWLFTGIFILSGALKSRSISAFLTFVAFLICSLSFVFIESDDHVLRHYFSEILAESDLSLNFILGKIFGAENQTPLQLVNSSLGLKIQSFIAFSYTYHYLNWFVKVKIIKWHQVEKNYLMISAVFWLASLGVYAYDYKTGAIWLLFLSVLHVFLEFPLNLRTIGFVVKNVRL
jgi:hypothetical protein